VVCQPTDDVAGVGGHQGLGASLDVQAQHVEDLAVALVVRHQDVVRVVGQIIDDAGAHALVRRQVAHGAGGGIDGHDVEVLVAAEVLFVQDRVVAFETKSRDVACTFARQLARLADRLAALQLLYENVAALGLPRLAFGRLHETEPLAAGAEAEVSPVGVAKELAQRNLRHACTGRGGDGQLGRGGRLRLCRQRHRKRHRNGAADERTGKRESGSQVESLHGRVSRWRGFGWPGVCRNPSQTPPSCDEPRPQRDERRPRDQARRHGTGSAGP
jgi:hypothetical protein